MIELAKIDGIAWTWPNGAIELEPTERIKLLCSRDALITVTSEWKEVLCLPLDKVPFFKIERDYLRLDPAIPLRTARIDGPVWAKIIYSIVIHREGTWKSLSDDHEI